MIQGVRYLLNGVVCYRNSRYIGYIWDTTNSQWLVYDPCDGPVMIKCIHTEAKECKASKYGELFFYTIYC